jgi:hypothetical protein
MKKYFSQKLDFNYVDCLLVEILDDFVILKQFLM